ncbi:hypothetical protein B7P43_G10494 [Cryptotermes secundus]|uniref:Uncharacterized protein n=1 Tax=Cryptotermes secundus TaxID=105785 RepID=A0A2J7PJ66_9NEOP|nr:uncharacterized protein LOC111873624 isoform X2 [Cryptotermes secundus]PNF16386.1 hypothetical protein B7P43_G10494 [Cryptotermes secundus]
MFQKTPLISRNMKVLSVIALGVFALSVIAFRNVATLPKLKSTAAAPFDWQQFLPQAQKRAAAYPGDDPSSAGDINSVYSAVPSKLATNPMSPFLSLKPFLPVKPTIVSPFVDPNIFIGKKAALLNNLFGSGIAPAPAGMPFFFPPWISGGVISPPGFFAEKKTLLGTAVDSDASSSSLDSKRALTEPEPEHEATVSAQPRLVIGPPSIWGPPAAVTPTVKPTIVPPGYWSPFADGSSAAGPVPPVVDPSVFLDKKTKFLSELFNSLSATPSTSEVSARAIATDESTTDPLQAVPPNFWLQFIPAFATPPPAPTVKPTIVPPGFWVPSVVTKPAGFFGPSVPVVDPAQFIDKKTAFLKTLFSTLNITVTPAPVTTPEPTLDPVIEYEQKVAEFLDKLFTAIINNDSAGATAKRDLAGADETAAKGEKNFLGKENEVYDSTRNAKSKTDAQATDETGDFTRRSVDTANDTSSVGAQQLPVDALLSAKDKVVDTIIAEMGGIKNNILATLAELITKQKEAAATPPPTPAPKKKPGPSFGPGGPFGFGGPFSPWAKVALTTTTPKPTPDPEPFQKKVEFLSQVFDTLTKLEKDVTEALSQAVSEAAAAATTTTTSIPTTPETKPIVPTSQVTNGTKLIDLIRSKLIELANSSAHSQTSEQGSLMQQVPKYARAIKPTLTEPVPTIVDPSFWIPDTAAGAVVGPDYYIGKTQSFLSKLFASKAAKTGDDDQASTDNKARSIKMAVHQGYQSLPPGSEELLQAGGGTTPQKHEGGGLKLQIKVPA